MEIYILATLIKDKSQYWSGSNIYDCIDFVRSTNHRCLFYWNVRIYNKDSGKRIYSGNLGNYASDVLGLF